MTQTLLSIVNNFDLHLKIWINHVHVSSVP